MSHLRVVDGGTARRTIVSIHDAVDAVMLMLSERARAENQIFNIGSRANEVTILELADLMRRTYAEVTGDPAYNTHPIEFVTGTELYGDGYEDCDRRMPRLDKATRAPRLGSPHPSRRSPARDGELLPRALRPGARGALSEREPAACDSCRAGHGPSLSRGAFLRLVQGPSLGDRRSLTPARRLPDRRLPAGFPRGAGCFGPATSDSRSDRRGARLRRRSCRRVPRRCDRRSRRATGWGSSARVSATSRCTSPSSPQASATSSRDRGGTTGRHSPAS